MFPRDRLFRELDWNRRSACTWIAGPPGSGKTALIASFVRERSLPCLWYQVDAGDSDPVVFFTHLSAAARANLGAAAIGLPPFPAGSAFAAQAFAPLFFRQLFALAPQLMIALDDYHHARADCPLHDILCVAIGQAPAGAHVAVTSRSRPPSALARAQANGAIRSIAWDQLMLKPDEVAGIAGIHGLMLTLPAAEEWHERCGGWAAGLRLLLKANTALPARTAHNGARAMLFDYLGREIFHGLPQALRSLLLQVAYLPQVPAGIANSLAGGPTAERQLAALADENLFTSVAHGDGGALPTYRLHPLFREFLIHRADIELTADEVLARRHGAAEALQAAGLVEEAAQVWAEAQAWGRLGELVLAQAPQFIAQGRQATLERWLSQLPAAQLKGEPWLLHWRGACRALHDPWSGRASAEAAFDLFDERHDRAGLLLSWSAVVDCIVRSFADLRPLDGWIERLESMLAADGRFPSPEVEARVTFSMFVALSFRQPQHAALPAWRQRLAAATAVAPDPMFRLLVRCHLALDQVWQGDLHAAGAELRKLNRKAARLPASPVLELFERFAESTIALYGGEVAQCFDAIDRALAAAELSGIHIWDKVLLGQGAALALSQGDLARGRAFARRRSAIARPADDEEQAHHHLIEAWSHWLGGMPADALAHVRLGAGCAERMGLPHFNAVCCLSAAIVSFDCGDPDAALGQVESGRAIGTLTRNPMLLWMADLLEAYMRLRRGEDASALIASGMAAGRQHGYRHFIFWPGKAVALVCFKALEAGIELGYATDLIEKGRLAAPPDAVASDLWPWPVKVTTLGAFRVVVRGTPVSFRGKAQRAPLNLLKALIAFGGHDVAESSLIDALWPDSDGVAGEQTLATTLFRLRKLVGADVVTRQGGRLGVAVAECWVDCRALERLLKSGVDDDSLVERVRRLYAGPFLQGEDDAPWALPLRERLHVALVKKLSMAAAAALGSGRIELAHGIYEAGIDIDDLVEAFYAGHIHCHITLGETSLAVTTYRRCQRVLQSRLGVAPSQATTRLYLSAIRGAGA